MKSRFQKEVRKIKFLIEQAGGLPQGFEYNEDDFITQDDYHSNVFAMNANDDITSVPEDVTILIIQGENPALDLSILCDFARLEIVNLKKANVQIPNCLLEKDASGTVLLVR